jgi:hypothetical protein
VPERSQVAMSQPPAQRNAMPNDDATAEREIDAIIARLDTGIASDFEAGSSEPANLIDRITGSVRRVFGIGSTHARKVGLPANDEAAEEEIDATIARLDAGIAQAKGEMDELLPKLRGV